MIIDLDITQELVFVNGHRFDGKIISDRLKGIGWESGRTAQITLTPNPNPEDDVILVDLIYGKIRRCFWLETELNGLKETCWCAEDFLNSFRDIVKVEQLSPPRDHLLK